MGVMRVMKFAGAARIEARGDDRGEVLLARGSQFCHTGHCQNILSVSSALEQYDEAMFAFSQAEYDRSIESLKALLAENPAHFDAQLALGMAYYRKGELEKAIAEGHKAEELRPKEQLVHTNLSLFYMKAGDKQKAEHHGLQARIAGWRENMAPSAPDTSDPELQLAKPAAPNVKTPPKLPEMPWKKKPGEGPGKPAS
jgi:Flp pilus assembly protein TadD